MGGEGLCRGMGYVGPPPSDGQEFGLCSSGSEKQGTPAGTSQPLVYL